MNRRQNFSGDRAVTVKASVSRITISATLPTSGPAANARIASAPTISAEFTENRPGDSTTTLDRISITAPRASTNDIRIPMFNACVNRCTYSGAGLHISHSGSVQSSKPYSTFKECQMLTCAFNSCTIFTIGDGDGGWFNG